MTTVPVSVVIPCYRCVRTIERAVASVAAQTVLPSELVLVDDGSADDTRAMLNDLRDRHQPGWILLVLLDQNVGAASARNAGWAVANQPYIAFLDSDDAWHPRKIEIQHAYMKEHPDVVLCGHGYRRLNPTALPDWNVVQGDVQRIRKWAMILSNPFVTPSVMVRSDVGQRFVEKQRYMEDHMLWLKIICSGGRVVKLGTELAAIYKEPFGVAGLSAQVWLMERSDLGNYRRLYDENFIKGYQLAILDIYSILKYVRRLLIYGGYLRWKK
ncbi:Glycosyltransferase involved in cell wall bisynthesis [Polaromonas sp. OV174]|uniref:glycosyltransferase family 2 protein n=1 Tax=Polaromonas sp. OV174 TaxID=1855300 RepID=UPI0008E38776|nr:glycosyltransferase family 2 protein [Polaromonas sp. OV174]SFB66800.1 Glycosyltransferase involved in cell wall bisynthesis [Polaromonas sp. OV174]